MQDFFIRAQDWILFAALTDRNKLVLPKAPHGFAVTGFLLGCLGKRACHAPNKKALNTSCWGLCAQDWIRTSTPFPALPPQGSASTNFATWAHSFRKGDANIRNYFGRIIANVVPLPTSDCLTKSFPL